MYARIDCTKQLAINEQAVEFAIVYDPEDRFGGTAKLHDLTDGQRKIIAQFFFKVSDDGKVLSSFHRSTSPQERQKGLQRLLTEEVVKNFPQVAVYKASLSQTNAISVFQHALANLTGKSPESFKSRDDLGMSLALELESRMQGLTETERSDILNRAVVHSPEYRLARGILGKVKIRRSSLKLISESFAFDLAFEFEK